MSRASGGAVKGITTTSQVFLRPSWSISIPEVLTGAAAFFACVTLARRATGSRPRAICMTLFCGAPGAGSRNAPVCPRNCRTSIFSLTTIPGGA